MIKKAFALGAIMAMAGSALFALDVSVGGGIMLGGTFNKMETEDTDTQFPNPAYSPSDPSYGPQLLPAKISSAYSVNDFDIGAFVFADCQYAELSMGFLQQIGKVTDIKPKMSVAGQPYPIPAPDDEDYLSSLLLIDLLGKYPFVLSEKASIYPAVGVMLRIPVAGNDYSDTKHEANWGFGIKARCGLDWNVTDSLFIRNEVLCYFELAADKDIKIEEQGSSIDFKVKNAGYYIQPQVKVSVGYKLGGAK
jgi:hypothetical protein